MDSNTIGKLFERLETLGGEVHEIHILVTRALTTIESHSERLDHLEQVAHQPQNCQLAAKIEGVYRDNKSLLRTMSWVIGLISAAITGTMAVMITKVLAK
jgi:hypothetical protein